MINQPTQPGIPASRGWKFLIISILILTIFFRFANLDQKVYSADEVRKILRFSGYTSQEFIERMFTGDIVSVAEIQKYQYPTPERNLSDAIKALSGNPEHPPLYQLMARVWMEIVRVKNSARIFSILLSFLVFPCLYWLSRELFESPITAWVAIPLIGISPFHILAAQNTTQYSLWTVAIFLSSAALLKALRINDKQSWIVYAATVAMGFYTHLFFALVVFGHGIYVVIIEGWRFSKRLIAYGIASIAGLLIFAPWIVVILNNLGKLDKNTTHYRLAKNNLSLILWKFSSNICNLFADLHNTTRIENFLDYLILLLVVYVLALSYIVEPKVKFQLGKPNDVEEWQKKINLSENIANFSDVFLYFPDDEFLNFINRDPKFESHVVVSSKDGRNKWLYQVVKK